MVGFRSPGAAARVCRDRERQSVGNGQTLPALGSATLQHDAAVLRVHTNEEPMGAPATATVGLKSALHWTPGRVTTPWRNWNRNERRKGVSIVSLTTGPVPA